MENRVLFYINGRLTRCDPNGDRLQGYGNITFTYNNNGSVTGKTVGGNTTSYSYNLANRLTQVTAAGLNASHGYDFFGRRVEKNVNGQITRFLYDGTTLMAELDQTNSITKRYAYLPGRLTPFVMVEEGDSSSASDTNVKFLETLAGLYNVFDGITPLAYAARPSGPSITRVRPSQCEPGELIIITGKKFGDTRGNSIVHIGSDTFDSGSSRIEVWSNKEIRIRVPDYACEWFGGQDYKEPDVWVTVGGADSNMKTLKVLKPASCTSTSGPGTYYFINNHLGYPQKLVDDNLTVVWSSSSQVFGHATVNEDPDGNGQTVVNNIRFPGQYYDQESGLHYNYYRYYDPKIGRYLRADPIRFAGSKNLYEYVLNNPINVVDPHGLSVKWIETLYWILVDNSTPHPGITQILISGALMDDSMAGREYVERRIKDLERAIKDRRELLISKHYAHMARCDAEHTDPCENRKCRDKAYDDYVDAAMKEVIPYSDKLGAYRTINRTFFNYD